MTLLNQKINACRIALQKAIQRAEKIQKIQERIVEEIKDDHIKSEDLFLTEQESIFGEIM